MGVSDKADVTETNFVNGREVALTKDFFVSEIISACGSEMMAAETGLSRLQTCPAAGGRDWVFSDRPFETPHKLWRWRMTAAARNRCQL